MEHVTARRLLESLARIVHLRGNDGRSPEWLAGLPRGRAARGPSGRPLWPSPQPRSSADEDLAYPRGAHAIRHGHPFRRSSGSSEGLAGELGHYWSVGVVQPAQKEHQRQARIPELGVQPRQVGSWSGHRRC